MLCVTFTALVERFIALVKAYQAGTAVFMVEGLQLIIAVLLIILGLTIVLHSGKRLVSKETLKFKPGKSLLIYPDSSLAFFMLNYHEYHPAASTSTVPVQKSIAIVTILKFLSWPVQSLLSGPNCK